MDAGRRGDNGKKLRARPELIQYQLWAWEHGERLVDFLASRTGRELTALEALEDAIGPLGERRQDRRIAWLAFVFAIVFGGAKDLKPEHCLQSLLNWMTKKPEDDEADIITDDPDASIRKAKEIERMLRARFSTQEQAE